MYEGVVQVHFANIVPRCLTNRMAAIDTVAVNIEY